jgi:hypothetical protein
MSMSHERVTERASELLYDTASTLRLLDAELGELAPRRTAESSTMPVAAAASAALPSHAPHIAQALHEVHALLMTIRSGRERLITTSAITDVQSLLTDADVRLTGIAHLLEQPAA